MSVNRSARSTASDGGSANANSSLADALFTATQQRVLALLFGQPNRTFYLTQLVALARSGRGAMQRELARLAQSGLVSITNVGNQKHFQANRNSPLFEEVRSIIQKTVGLQEPLRAALESLPCKVRLALIYGSVAKQSDTALSDIDLLLVADNLTLEKVYEALAPVEKLLARQINPTLFNSQEFAKRRNTKNAFLSRVLDGATLVLLGSVDAT